MDVQKPTVSAFNQQRAKLKPEAFEAVFKQFNSSVASHEKSSGYNFIAADSSTFTFFGKPSFASDDYYVSQGHSIKGFYSLHLNAFYDLERHTYTDTVIQPVHHKDEFRAFCVWSTGMSPIPTEWAFLLVTGDIALITIWLMS